MAEHAQPDSFSSILAAHNSDLFFKLQLNGAISEEISLENYRVFSIGT